MKTPRSNSQKFGFTLVELLVVIAIIAVLAAAGFAGGNAAIQKARKVTALSVASSLESAVERFYADYSALPNVASETDTSNGELLNILMGLETTDIQNDRKISYLSIKEAKGGRDGIVYSGDTVSGLYDSWSQPYYVVLDNEEGEDGYDEQLTFKPQGSNPQVTLRGRRVAVYSHGTDNPASSTPRTLVKTW